MWWTLKRRKTSFFRRRCGIDLCDVGTAVRESTPRCLLTDFCTDGCGSKRHPLESPEDRDGRHQVQGARVEERAAWGEVFERRRRRALETGSVWRSWVNLRRPTTMNERSVHRLLCQRRTYSGDYLHSAPCLKWSPTALSDFNYFWQKFKKWSYPIHTYVIIITVKLELEDCLRSQETTADI